MEKRDNKVKEIAMENLVENLLKEYLVPISTQQKVLGDRMDIIEDKQNRVYKDLDKICLEKLIAMRLQQERLVDTKVSLIREELKKLSHSGYANSIDEVDSIKKLGNFTLALSCINILVL